MEKWLYEINGKTEHIFDTLNSNEDNQYHADTLSNFLEFFDLAKNKNGSQKTADIINIFLNTNEYYNIIELTYIIPILLLIRDDLLITNKKEALIQLKKFQNEGHDCFSKIFDIQKKYNWSLYKTTTILFSSGDGSIKNFLSGIKFFDYSESDCIDNISSWIVSQIEYLETEVRYCDKCTNCGSFYPVYRISAQNTTLCPYCRNKRLNETYIERTKKEPILNAYHRLYHSFYNYVRIDIIEKKDFQDAMAEIKKIRDKYLYSGNTDENSFKKEATDFFYNFFPNITK